MDQWCVLSKNDSGVLGGKFVTGPFDNVGDAEKWIREDLESNGGYPRDLEVLPYFAVE